MVLLDMRERSCRGDWVHLVVAVVVERHVHERVIREPKNDVANVVGFASRELIENPFDSLLVLVRRLGRPHRVTRYQSLLHDCSFHRCRIQASVRECPRRSTEGRADSCADTLGFVSEVSSTATWSGPGKGEQVWFLGTLAT